MIRKEFNYMKNELSYAFKGIIRALGEGVCANILLPIWYVFIRLKNYISNSDVA